MIRRKPRFASKTMIETIAFVWVVGVFFSIIVGLVYGDTASA